MIKTEQRWLDILAVVLFVFALWLVSMRLIVTKWTGDLSLVQHALLLAAVVGMALGYSIFKLRTVRWLGFAYSLISLTWFFTRLMPSEMVWAEKIIRISQGFRYSVEEFIRNEPVQGSLLFMVFMIFAFWWIGLIAGFQMTRHGNPWIPLVILFCAYLVIEYYPPLVKSRHFLSAITVLTMLLLLGRLYFVKMQASWNEKHALIDFGAGFDVTRNMAIVGLFLVVAAWGIPGIISLLTPGTVQQQKFVEFWKPLQDRLANAVMDLKSPRTVNFDFFSQSMPLGTEISGDETPVFIGEVSAPRARGFNYYWHGYAYDTYEAGTWTNSIEDFETIKPSDWPLALPDWDARQKVNVSIYWQYQRSRLIYLPANPIVLSRPVQWYAEQTPDGYDGAAIIASTSVYVDEAYSAEVLVSIPTITQLLEAGEEYPDWVTERYLQLPEDLPPSIEQLAQEITTGMQTPYEATTAITQYLRDSIEYTEKIETPPENHDLLEWFLFETRQGFCNYYATAEVVLLRSLGIPARLVVGFAQGEQVEGTNQYLVRVNDGHAWPEVFFPGIGWVEFEPTTSRQPLELIYDDISAYDPDSMGIYEDGRQIRRDLAEGFFIEGYTDEGTYDDYARLPRVYYPWREWGIFLGVMALLGLVFWLQKSQGIEGKSHPVPVLFRNLFRKWGWETPAWLQFIIYRSSLTLIERNFSEIAWMLKILDIAVGTVQTPVEQVDALLKRLPQAEQPAKDLLNEYQLSMYSPRKGDVEKARLAHSHLWMIVFSAAVKQLIQR